MSESIDEVLTHHNSLHFLQLPRERCGGDATSGCAATCQKPAAVGPAPGGHARVGQLQHGDTRGEGLLVRRRDSEHQPNIPHQQGTQSQHPPGVRIFLLRWERDALGAKAYNLVAHLQAK